MGKTWYRCLIRGENFPGEMIGQTHPVGFYTTRYVADATPEAAELAALSVLKHHKSLQLPDGVAKPKEARVYFEEIVEVGADEVPDEDMGLSFYPMED